MHLHHLFWRSRNKSPRSLFLPARFLPISRSPYLEHQSVVFAPGIRIARFWKAGSEHSVSQRIGRFEGSCKPEQGRNFIGCHFNFPKEFPLAGRYGQHVKDMLVSELNWLRRKKRRKTAGEENQKRYAVARSVPRLRNGTQEQSCSIGRLGDKKKIRPLEKCFSLTPFIELHRS